MDLKRVQQTTHRTVAKLPMVDEAGKVIFEEIEIWFRPLTVNMLEALEAANADKQMSYVEAQAATLAKQLTRWSVTDEGQPVEPKFDVLKTLNKLHLDALIDAIAEYTFPKETT